MADVLFRGLVLCCSGLTPDVQAQVRKIVLAGGGTFELDLDLEATTHLIAEAVGSQKHRAAVDRGIPVASARWVFESLRAKQLLDVTPFLLRPLEGLVVCTTGLSDESREQVEQLTTSLGGVYDPALEIGYTGVLIAQKPGGAKYEAAAQHGVPVVHISWMLACAERSMLASEEEFALEKVLQPSRIYRQLADDVDDAVLVLPALVHACNQQNRMDSEGDGDTQNELPASLFQGENDDDENEWTDLFESCVFHLVGFPARMQAALQRIIRRGMGTIYNELVLFQVTHVLVSPSLSDLSKLRSIEDRVAAANADGSLFFVSARWLVDSLKCSRLEPEELYPVEIDDEHYHPDLIQTSTAVRAEISSSSKLIPTENPSFPPAHDEPEALETAALEPAAEELPKRKAKMFQDKAFLVVCVDPNDTHLIKPMVERIKDKGGAEAIPLDYHDFGMVSPEQFGFVTHAVICNGVALDEAEVVQVQSRFEHYHRKLESAQQDADGQAGNNHDHPRSNRKRRRGTLTLVSDLWVNCSLAVGMKLSYQSHELFSATLHQPRSIFPVRLPLKCFRQVRATVTVYMDVDRVVIEELLRLAGARVTGKLDRKNTHLICQKPIGRKYEKALELGLTIVSARWVVESIIHGELFDAGREEYQVREEHEVIASQDYDAGTQ